ncbi:hypothetical protein ACFX13_019279 [Malus domestica]
MALRDVSLRDVVPLQKDLLGDKFSFWVAQNIAAKQPHHEKTTGIIELGGASAQVTFVSSEPVPPEFSRAVKFGNVTYNLYSHSFLHFSQNVAYDSLKEGIVSGDFDSGKDTSFAFFTDYMMP